MPTISITLPPLHAGQQPIADNPARFRVLACGRRWGKTRLGAALCIKVALEGGRAWWVAPSYKMAQVGWRLINRLAQQITGAEVRRGEMLVTMPSGGEVQVRSADNPDSLRGEGLDFVVMDECAFMQEEAWLEAIRPALSDRLGRAVFISTPKGRNWFWRAFQAGQSGGNEWASWQIPTIDNPHINAAEVEAARLGLPERVFRQEYLAEFIDDAGGVFRGVMEAATAVQLEQGQAGRQYVIGVDVAAMVDFTVITAVDVKDRAVVYIDRFNRVDYPMLTERIKAAWERFGRCPLIVESNSIGQPVIDMLTLAGLPVQGFTTTSATKANAIQALQSAFEHHTITIIPDPVLINELQSFEGERTATGMRYAAPPGMHDDCVMSLAIAWSGIESGADLFLFGV